MSALASPTYALPRNYYLLVHDALRRLLGTGAELAAFVKTKQPFQCDMLVRAVRTDCDVLAATPQGIEQLAQELSAELGVCSVAPCERRLDVTFSDKSVLRLALGAPRQSLEAAVGRSQGSSSSSSSSSSTAASLTTAMINAEPDWRRRNRLRISFGFDEALFLQSCSPLVCHCAAKLTRWARRTVQRDRFFIRSPEAYDAFMRAHEEWDVVTPPPSFWYAHAYLAQRAFHVTKEDQLFEEVYRNFAHNFGVYPLDNPFCPGEDLHTMDVARWICRASIYGPATSQMPGLDAVAEERDDEDDASNSAANDNDGEEDDTVDEERLRRLLR